jgi:hypothetical protein
VRKNELRHFTCNEIDELLKTVFILDRYVSQHLAVKFDLRAQQQIDELRIRKAQHLALSADPYYPQPPHLSFFQTAMGVGKSPGAFNAFGRGTNKAMTRAAKTARSFQYFLSSPTRSRIISCPWHKISSFLLSSERDLRPFGDGNYPYGNNFLILRASDFSDRTWLRSCRLRFFDLSVNKWRRPCLLRLILPLLVILKRFLTDLFVFNLGIVPPFYY